MSESQTKSVGFPFASVLNDYVGWFISFVKTGEVTNTRCNNCFRLTESSVCGVYCFGVPATKRKYSRYNVFINGPDVRVCLFNDIIRAFMNDNDQPEAHYNNNYSIVDTNTNKIVWEYENNLKIPQYVFDRISEQLSNKHHPENIPLCQLNTNDLLTDIQKIATAYLLDLPEIRNSLLVTKQLTIQFNPDVATYNIWDRTNREIIGTPVRTIPDINTALLDSPDNLLIIHLFYQTDPTDIDTMFGNTIMIQKLQSKNQFRLSSYFDRQGDTEIIVSASNIDEVLSIIHEKPKKNTQ